MGNAEAHTLANYQEEHQAELDLSQTLNYKQYCRVGLTYLLV